MSGAIVFENREFMDDLSSSGRAIRSVVYCSGVATINFYEWLSDGLLAEKQKHYPADQVPQVRLKDKFRKVSP